MLGCLRLKWFRKSYSQYFSCKLPSICALFADVQVSYEYEVVQFTLVKSWTSIDYFRLEVGGRAGTSPNCCSEYDGFASCLSVAPLKLLRRSCSPSFWFSSSNETLWVLRNPLSCETLALTCTLVLGKRSYQARHRPARQTVIRLLLRLHCAYHFGPARGCDSFQHRHA